MVVWYKEVVQTGKYYKEGLARLSEIEIGDGEASELESIKFQVNWSRTPEKHDITSAPASATSGRSTESASGTTGTPSASGPSSAVTSPAAGG